MYFERYPVRTTEPAASSAEHQIDTTAPSDVAAAADDRPRLASLADASAIVRGAVRDKAYRETPVGALVGQYIRWFRNEWGATPSTIRDYEGVLARMSVSLYDKAAQDVTIEDLREVIDLWAARAPKTRAKVTSVIRSFWEWAEQQDHVALSPAAKIRRPRVPKKVAPLLPLDANTQLLTGITSPRDRLALHCLLDLGLRRNELRGIRVRDFDVGRRTLRVYGKGQKERVLPLRGDILNALAFYLQADLPHAGRPPEQDDWLLYPTHKLFAGRGSEGEQLREVRGYPKKQPSDQYVHRWWYRMLENVGLVKTGVRAGLNMHLARHTFATELRRVAGIEAASQALGHSELNTTLGIYGHQDDSDLERAMDKFAEARHREPVAKSAPPTVPPGKTGETA